MKKVYPFLTIAFAMTLAIAGCNYERIKGAPGAVTAPENLANPEHIPSTFAEIQSLILKSTTCYGCHGPDGKSGIEIHEYNQVMDYVTPGKPEFSDLYLKLESEEMPKSPNKITGKLLEGVKVWIENGAKEKE